MGRIEINFSPHSTPQWAHVEENIFIVHLLHYFFPESIQFPGVFYWFPPNFSTANWRFTVEGTGCKLHLSAVPSFQNNHKDHDVIQGFSVTTRVVNRFLTELDRMSFSLRINRNNKNYFSLHWGFSGALLIYFIHALII